MNVLNKVISFYCFTSIKKESVSVLKKRLMKYELEGITGLIILATEGINGTICGSEKEVSKFFNVILGVVENQDLNEKISYSNKNIFKNLKIKIKPEIVTIGIDDLNPKKYSGVYLEADEWNLLIEEKDTLLIDTRNHYEISLGSFKNSINPNTKNFREFPEWIERNLNKLTNNKKNINIAMYCTGGIRCEKATSLLKKKGYKNIYHLKGGILKYFENISMKKNLFKGECYVFDERVALNNELKQGNYTICHACGMPLSSEDKNKKTYIKGIQCHLCVTKFSDSDRRRFAERQKQIDKKNEKLNSY